MLPYYNKPTPEGQYRHYKAIHDAVDIPIIIYNVPPRTAVDMTVETMARLAKLPRIVGVKDATADLARPMLTRIAIGPQFCQLSGEDGDGGAVPGPGRPWLHLRHRERGAAALLPAARGLAARATSTP